MYRFLIPLLLIGCGEDKLDDTQSDTDAGACDEYLACVSAATPSDLGDEIATYGDEGSCWEQDASLCDAACEAGLDQLRLDYADPACWDDSCGEFMAWWTSSCSALADEAWCEPEWQEWTACVMAEGGCAPDACAHLAPLADDAVYQPGTWQATWTVADYEECFEAEDPEGALEALGQFTLDGDGVDELELEGSYLVKYMPFPSAADCEITGTDFTCMPEGDTIWGWGGTFTSLTQASIRSLQPAKAYCTFDLQGTMVPVN